MITVKPRGWLKKYGKYILLFLVLALAALLVSPHSRDRLGLPRLPAEERPEVKVTNPASEVALFLYTLPEGVATAELAVYDALGRIVYGVRLSPTEGRYGEYAWRLTDSEGKPLANGLYVFTIVADGTKSAIHRLVIRR